MSTTRVEVLRDGEHHRTRVRAGLLRAQPLHAPSGGVRLGLLATTALLLGGDAVSLEVVVGEGARLELHDIAGTVAYHGRGAASRWDVAVRVARGGALRWSGEPLVVADGADVTRTLRLEVADGGRALLRETTVLGRAGERGGRLRLRADVAHADRPVLLEDTVLDPDGLRTAPGMLGELRVLDAVLAVGVESGSAIPGLPAYRLPGGSGTLHRWLGRQAAASPLVGRWPGWRLSP